MALTDAEIQALKVPYGRNQYKVSDGGGLYLLVQSSGRYWKLAYRFDGKQKALALGVYPEVGIEQAREKRDAAKALIADNIDPGEIRKQEKQQQRDATAAAEEQAEASQPDQPAEIARSRRQAQLAAIDPLEQAKSELRRLLILQSLADSPSYARDESAIHAKLEAAGVTLSYDRLRIDIAWLYEMQLLQLDSEGLWRAHLTQAGFDAALGRRWVPGVRRPESDSDTQTH